VVPSVVGEATKRLYRRHSVPRDNNGTRRSGEFAAGTLDNLRGKSRISEEDIEDIVKEIQRSLLQADVDVSLVQELSDNIKSRALDEEPPGGTSPRDWVLRIVYEELVELVGESTELPLEEQTIMLAGLQGSGKTTTAAKMAWWFSKKGSGPPSSRPTPSAQAPTTRPNGWPSAPRWSSTASPTRTTPSRSLATDSKRPRTRTSRSSTPPVGTRWRTT